MNARRLGIALFALVATVVVGGAAAADGPSPRAARTVNVTVGDDFYRPARLAVAPRTRVRWIWRGRDIHNVTVTSGPRRFSSRTQARGTFARTLRARGTYRIVCTVHGQRMRIRVR
jgi:plastocyanin